MGFVKYWGWSHAVYIFITAVWPIIDIESFMVVTGPKTDIWLVKTVGALLIPVSITMIVNLVAVDNKWPLITLGAGIAIAFICVDCYYALNDVISNIYLADAAVEFMFLVGWIVSAAKYNSRAGRVH